MELSVNLNKVALLRNARGGKYPSLLRAAEVCIDAGASGLTLHWREDNRHAKRQDVVDLCALAKQRGVEFNLEGDLREELIVLAIESKVSQCTLVPVTPGEITSDHGWSFPSDAAKIKPIVSRLQQSSVRTAVFVDPIPSMMKDVAQVGVDRIEIYTEPYAASWGTSSENAQFELVKNTAKEAAKLGLGVNAGHDLNLKNIVKMAKHIPEILEVSIGHALIADSLHIGLPEAVSRYVKATRGLSVDAPRIQ